MMGSPARRFCDKPGGWGSKSQQGDGGAGLPKYSATTLPKRQIRCGIYILNYRIRCVLLLKLVLKMCGFRLCFAIL